MNENGNTRKIPACLLAIGAIEDDLPALDIELPDRYTQRGKGYAPASAIAEWLHLGVFIGAREEE